MPRSAARSTRASFGRTLPAVAILVATIPAQSRAQQSDLSVGPFLSYFPSAGASPLAGIALSLANGPIGFRASGNLSLADRASLTASASGVRPWGADADMLLMLGNSSAFRRGLSPFVFAGVGTAATDWPTKIDCVLALEAAINCAAGTSRVTVLLLRTRVHSVLLKKNNFCLTIGPPAE